MDKNSDRDVPFIDEIKLEGEELVIKGNWPNPAWKFKKYLYNKEDDFLHVFILGEKTGDVSIQVLNPFEYRVSLKELKDKHGVFKEVIVHSREGREHVLSIED